MKNVLVLCMTAVLWGAQAESQTVRGVVLEDYTRMPIGGAAVQLIRSDGSKAEVILSDSGGVFVLRAGRAGRYSIEVTHPSYATVRSAPVAVEAGDLVVVELRMNRQAIPLEPLLVTSRANERLGGFYERMQRGGGYFLTRLDIEKRPGVNRATDLMQGMAGVEVIPIRRARGAPVANVIAMRGPGGRCPPAIFVNGLPLRQLGESGIDELVAPSNLEAVEVYPSRGRTPLQFEQPRTCGAVVFWTRALHEGEGSQPTWKRIGVAAGIFGFFAAMVAVLGI